MMLLGYRTEVLILKEYPGELREFKIAWRQSRDLVLTSGSDFADIIQIKSSKKISPRVDLHLWEYQSFCVQGQYVWIYLFGIEIISCDWESH